jgi:hypothetical protein
VAGSFPIPAPTILPSLGWAPAQRAQAAKDVFGADEVYPLEEMPLRVQRMTQRASQVLFDFDRAAHVVQGEQLQAALREAAGRHRTAMLRPLLHK